jgi:4-amino-4-deoxy-L-arabinose transferase-like glycosyltransferase
MALSVGTHNSRGPAVLCGLLALAAVVRIISSYSLTSQAFDEPCHLAAAIERLSRHTYTLDPVHPPLARIAIGPPLYLGGERYPKLSLPGREITDHDVENAVLSDSGHYARNLALARLGVLPFFLLATAIVFLWARREYGDFAAVMAAALFTTLPNVLGFSSIANTDMVAAATQVGLFFAFVEWLDKATKRSALWLGWAAGLASKVTTVIFFPAAATAVILGKWLGTRTIVGENAPPRQIVRHVAIVAALAIVTLWASYGFAVGHVREGMNLSAESIPSFRQFPAPLVRAGRWLVASNPPGPCFCFDEGVADAWVLNKDRPAAYLMGHIKHGGWWYFFLVGVAVKSPLPFLVLAVLGAVSLKTLDAHRRWRAMAPLWAALAVLLVTMPVGYNAAFARGWWSFPCSQSSPAADVLISGISRNGGAGLHVWD